MIIVLFHALYLFGKYVYENFHNLKEKTEDTMVANKLLNVSEADYQDPIDDEQFTDNYVKIKFFPPVYVQRYNTVQSVLASAQYHGKIQKVIDFGCAELSFAIHLKNTDGIQEIYCIDVDRPLLENVQTKVAPLHCDYLSLRTEPLTIHVCEGSIAHNDNKLANTDAVICIELIEHLYPDDLDAFPYNVFGFIKPQVAIVTTPNADFNVLFRLNGFRHDDHKFEWTRAQFQDWASNIVLRYPDYEVSFHGIGAGPGGTEHLGSCSQMAVFHRHTQLHNERPEGVDGLLKTVVTHKYPHRADNRSDEEKMLAEAEYYIRLFSSRHEEYSEEIPLETLMFSVEKFRISIEILKNILEEANWAIAERENGPVVLIPPQSTFSLNSDADFDDFLDNDYRHHDGEDDWDALESGHFIERGQDNHEAEENWDDQVSDTPHTDLNYLNVSNDTLNSSEHNSSLTMSLSHLSETSNSLGTDSDQSLSMNRNPTLPHNHFEGSSQSGESNTGTSSEGSRNIPLQLKLCSGDPLTLSLKSAAIDQVDCKSAHNETSSISTVEATFLLSHEQSLVTDNKDLLMNDGELLRSQEFPDTGRESLETSIDSVAQGSSAAFLLAEKSISNNDDSCSIYLEPCSSSDNSLYPKNEVSHLSIKDSSEESYENLDVSEESIDSSYQKCETDLINRQKNISEGIKSQDSMSFKSISDSSLDLKPKYTSSPQVGIDIHRIQTQSEHETQQLIDQADSQHDRKSSSAVQTLNIEDKYCEDTCRSNMNKKGTRESLGAQSSQKKIKFFHTNDVSLSEGNTMDENNGIHNCEESKTVENISPSPSQFSLQSNSDISLSGATSTGSSNVEKWYAAETNPMYQQDFVVLKGGNEMADNPNEETASDSDATLSGSEKGRDRETAKVIDQRSRTPDRCYKLVINNQLQGNLSKDVTDDFGETKSGLKNVEMKIIQDKSGKLDDDVDMHEIFPQEISNCKSTLSHEVSTSYNGCEIAKERGQLKCDFDPMRVSENLESKTFSPESLDTPPNSWSPEVMDSGYPNSASVHDITPEYELSSIANDRISDSDSASVEEEEAPVQGFYEFVEVENGDLANNNRDGEGNNVIAFEANDLDDLQPLIDVLENDMENENDIYVLQNGFPLWLLRILEMANPIDLEARGGPQGQLYPAPLEQAGGDAPNLNADQDEGFDSSSSDDDTDIEDDEVDDATTISSDETEDHSAENLRRDWRAGGDP